MDELQSRREAAVEGRAKGQAHRRVLVALNILESVGRDLDSEGIVLIGYHEMAVQA